MRLNLFLIAAVSFAPVALVSSLAGCEDKKPAATPAQKDDHGHKDDHAHNADGSHPAHSDHGGPVVDLGEQTIGTFTAKATRDQGEIVAGKDAAIDVSITPAAGASVKVAAVRFWIGTEDAKGSVKAKAEIEDPKDPSRWHVHAEIPSPVPTGSKLWVEIEDDKGVNTVGSFDLKS